LNSRPTRSECPINCAVEFLGDKWSLLIVREMIFKGQRTYGQLLEMDEGISTGTLAARVCKLEEDGVIVRRTRTDDKRSVSYSLTQKGKNLEPVLVEMVLWAADNEMPDLPKSAVDRLRKSRVFEPRYRNEQV